jgi:hypothetical protein
LGIYITQFRRLTLNHGYGYDQQVLHFDVKQDGAVDIVGTYIILSTSVLSKTDFYLDTTPETKAGVHFGRLESLTPNYSLEKEILDVDKEGVERLQMTIDPPLEPGDKLLYRWTAKSGPRTVATTKQELEASGQKNEYIFWDIIVPMKRLEIQATIPLEQTKPTPSVWVELWRISRFDAPLQTAYRAFLGEDPGRVKYSASRDIQDKVNIKLEIKNPWLAVRYVLAWDVPS